MKPHERHEPVAHVSVGFNDCYRLRTSLIRSQSAVYPCVRLIYLNELSYMKPYELL